MLGDFPLEFLCSVFIFWMKYIYQAKKYRVMRENAPKSIPQKSSSNHLYIQTFAVDTARVDEFETLLHGLGSYEFTKSDNGLSVGAGTKCGEATTNSAISLCHLHNPNALEHWMMELTEEITRWLLWFVCRKCLIARASFQLLPHSVHQIHNKYSDLFLYHIKM